MQKIEIEGIERTFESSWNELSLKKLHTIYQIIMQDTEGEIAADTELAMKKIEVFHALTWIDPVYLEVKKKEFEASYMDNTGELVFLEYLNDLLELVEPFFETFETEEGQTQWMISETLTKNPYPIFELKEKGKVGKSKFFGPKDECDNISMREFITLCAKLEAFEKTGAVKHIDNLIATLYRRPKPQTPDNLEIKYDGDIRLPYIEGGVEWREQKFKGINPAIKKLMGFWLLSCRMVFVNSYPLLFEVDDDNKREDKLKYLKLINALTNNDISKKDYTLNMRANDVLPLLEAMESTRRERNKDA